MPLHDALTQHALHRPDAKAVVIGAHSISFAALAERTAQINLFLAQLPRVKRPQRQLAGKPVFALLMGNHPQAVELLVAALAGPCCVVLLDPLLPKQQLRDILDSLPPDILFTTGQQADRLGRLACRVEVIETKDDLGELLQGIAAAPLQPPQEDDPFLVAFTSGTTSRPKAFVRTRRSWRVSLAAGRVHFQLDAGTDTLSPGPLAHGLSLYAFVETLKAGATFYGMEKFTPQAAWKLLQDQGPARLVCVPSVLDALCRHHEGGTEVLAGLTQVTTSGAKLAAPLLTRLRGLAPQAQVTEYYGASELGFVTSITHRPAASGYIQGGTGVGRAFPGVEIEIREIKEAEQDGGIGTIWVNSGLVIDGYLWQDDTVAFRRDGPWTTVGDIGRINERGDLELICRAGGMILSGGNNIYPDEIIACFKQHPAIKEVAVLGRPDAYLGNRLVAVLSFESAAPVPPLEELKAFGSARLQKYKVPRQLYQAAEWPMTSSGKISTGQLEQWLTQKDSRLVLL